MTAVHHTPPPETFVAKMAREKRERRARLGWPAQTAKQPPAPAPAPRPKRIEIREQPAADTRIQVVASTGQVVIITDKDIQAARAIFEPVSKNASVDRIKAEVCRRFHVSKNDLVSGRREFMVMLPRHIAIYLAKKLTTKSYPEIGRQFGGRDHTTIMHAIEKIERLLKTSESVREHVDALMGRLQGVASE